MVGPHLRMPLCEQVKETKETIHIIFFIYLIHYLLTFKQFNYEKTFSFIDAVGTLAAC